MCRISFPGRSSIQTPPQRRSQTGRMVRHIGQDVARRHSHFALETRLLYEKAFRDAFLTGVLDAASRAHQPIAKSLSGKTQQVFQRKVACFSYNQYGAFRLPMHRIGQSDRFYSVRGNLGTRDWVPYANISSWTMNKMVRQGTILVHRVHYTGWGTDKSLNQGGWAHRWNKQYQRNALQYNRV